MSFFQKIFSFFKSNTKLLYCLQGGEGDGSEDDDDDDDEDEEEEEEEDGEED